MPRLSCKFAIGLLVVFYLLGGHASAHGLAWCLGADGHAHVETGDCATEPSPAVAGPCLDFFGVDPDGSHSGAECRHLPVAAPHAPGVAQAPRDAAGKTISVLPLPSSALQPATDLSRRPCSPPPVELPPTVAQVALRSIVLLN